MNVGMNTYKSLFNNNSYKRLRIKFIIFISVSFSFLLGCLDVPGSSSSIEFGTSVSVSGDTIVVGAPLDDDNKKGDTGKLDFNSGSVYIFQDQNEGSSTKRFVAKLIANDFKSNSLFGHTVEIDNNTIVTAIADTTNQGKSTNGSFYILQREISGSSDWAQVAKRKPSKVKKGDLFGDSVDIDGNTVVAGAWGDTTKNGIESGSIYIFQRKSEGSNKFVKKANLLASDGEAGDNFGEAVAINGSTIVVGARGNDGIANNNRVSVYIFEASIDSRTGWVESSKLQASDGESGDNFGEAVAISGDTIVIGASTDNNNGISTGSCYIFQRDANGSLGWVEVVKLVPPDVNISAAFGEAVAISGDTVVISDQSSAYVFERNFGGLNNWGLVNKLVTSDGFNIGSSVSVSDNTIVVGASAINAVYVFEKDSGGTGEWLEAQILTPPI